MNPSRVASQGVTTTSKRGKTELEKRSSKNEIKGIKNRIRWFLGALFSKQWFIKTDEVKDSKV